MASAGEANQRMYLKHYILGLIFEYYFLTRDLSTILYIIYVKYFYLSSYTDELYINYHSELY